jgi:HAD superfamily hydrolase (TIGR01509 family)
MGAHLIEGIEAMLFDFEGTLVDFQWKLSEAVEEVLETLREIGFAKDRIRSRKYSTLLSEAMQMAAEFGLQPDQVRERIGDVYDRYDEDALTRWALRPGAKDFLHAIKRKGIHAALVSNVGGKTLSKALKKLGLEGFFEIALSRNDVLNLKPSPDGINLALERMGVSKDNSIFLGDSLDEILAAKPDYVIQSYKELFRAM